MSSEIKIRMYNVGFGDCFLIQFRANDRTFKILVDCGVHGQGPGPVKIAEIASQVIEDVTEGDKSRIDVVICTHRHQDHISGFARKSLWDKVEVGEVWMPWTEDPTDPEAKRIRDAQTSKARRVVNRLAHLQRTAVKEKSEMLTSLMEVARNALSNADAMDTLHNGFANEPIKRFLPKRNATRPWFTTRMLPGVKVHVLGPSRSEDVIRDMDPPPDEHYLWFDVSGDELSENSRDVQSGNFSRHDSYEQTTFESTADRGEEEKTDDVIVFQPGIGEPHLLKRFGDWVLTEYELGTINNQLIMDSKFRKKMADSLMEGFEYSVASLDDAVNGTSLMLVLEIGDHFLLLPGDAQWGTWNTALEDPRTRELLARCTFLKVSHHGSENATPVSLVEKVLSEDCIAMVCTRKNTLKWRIPQKQLVKEIRGHLLALIRSDEEDLPDPKAAIRDTSNLYVDLTL